MTPGAARAYDGGMDGQDDRRLAALMAAAQAGDATAYATVLRACVGLAASVARRSGVRPAAVDDVVQDVLLAIHRALPTYDPGRPFLPWLRAIARRRAIDALRQHARQGGREMHDPGAYLNHAGPDDAADLAVGRQDEAARLRSAIAALPPSQRQAVELLGLQERSLAEAATQSGRSKVALKVNLHRGLRALRGRFGGRDV
jgi:RNA polymerase sigma-70 factor (ECF subfamily)